MKKLMTSVLNLVQSALGFKRLATSLRPQITSNGYEIYYDEISGNVVGIVYRNLVFLKGVSERRMNWHDAVDYCKTIVINGITAELCPVDSDDSWEKEFYSISKSLYEALREIGAENLDTYTWCSEYSKDKAWLQYVGDSDVYTCLKDGCNFNVRPVLVLRR